MIALLAALALAPAPQTPPAEAKRVAVLINRSSSDSVKIGNYYVQKRGIPKENVLMLDLPAEEYISGRIVQGEILPAVRDFLGQRPGVDFVVTTKGVPIKFWRNVSVDSAIAAYNLRLPLTVDLREALQRNRNPYFGKDEAFSRAKFGIVLVTRLDGYTAEDAMRLVDNALAAKPAKGPFLLDSDPKRNNAGYGEMNLTLSAANDRLKGLGYETIFDADAAFASPNRPLMGYASWGSNDAAFDEGAYKRLRFLPGAIGETFVSTSGRTFLPKTGGQSVITDLIAGGITGVKGYVNEPYTQALARPNLLFDRYVRGYNLAESFYMASPLVAWMDVVIGDPLTRPYPRR